MKIISSQLKEDYDINADIKGLVEIKRLSLFEKTDKEIPSGLNIHPVGPCLLVEKLNEDLSRKVGVLALEPIAWCKLNDEQIKLLKTY